MSASLNAILLTLWLVPVLATGQECGSINTESAESTFKYLHAVGDRAGASACVDQAFQTISKSPVQRATPILIDLLGYKRPLSEGERLGIFMHGRGPDVLYPAVRELYRFGKPAEPALLYFISQSNQMGGVERDNALYALLLIHHGNALDVIRLLSKARSTSERAADRERLRVATKEAVKWCDDRVKSKCEELQK